MVNMYPKPGPMLGKQFIDVSALTADYENEDYPLFTITAATAGNIAYTDALGNDHDAEAYTAGQVVTGGPPGSAFPIPLLCRKIDMTDTTADLWVAWGP